jgi:hypothetical protein
MGQDARLHGRFAEAAPTRRDLHRNGESAAGELDPEPGDQLARSVAGAEHARLFGVVDLEGRLASPREPHGMDAKCLTRDERAHRSRRERADRETSAVEQANAQIAAQHARPAAIVEDDHRASVTGGASSKVRARGELRSRARRLSASGCARKPDRRRDCDDEQERHGHQQLRPSRVKRHACRSYAHGQRRRSTTAERRSPRPWAAR